MKAELREVLTDFKAAARIGHPESLRAALEGLRALPPVAANHPLDEGFLEAAILPLGEALAHPRLPLAALRSLAGDAQAGVRAVAAVALGMRHFAQGEPLAEVLLRLARDPRADVRAALGMALGRAGGKVPERLLEVIQGWLADQSPRARATGLLVAPVLAEAMEGRALHLLAGFESESDPQVRAALAGALQAFGEAGLGEQSMDVLEAWAGGEEPNGWVICRALCGSWAAARAGEALEILRTLAARSGPNPQVSNALEALARHGAAVAVRAVLQDWERDGDPNLRAAAERLGARSGIKP